METRLFPCTEPGAVWRSPLSLPHFGTSFVLMEQSVPPDQGEVPPAAGNIQSMLLSAAPTLNIVAKVWAWGGGVVWGTFVFLMKKNEADHLHACRNTLWGINNWLVFPMF